MKKEIFYILFSILLSQMSVVQAQKAVIRGKITEKSSGESIPGASIFETDAQNRIIGGTVSDINGNYVFEISDSQHMITVSSIGYSNQTFNVNNRTEINIALEEQSTALDEITITAKSAANEMTGVPQRDQTGSVTRLDMSELAGVAGSSAADALQGQVSGLDITSSGTPGGGSSLVIRGMGTIGNANPLIVIDGIAQDVRIEDFNFAAADERDLGQLLNIAPQDIQTIEVLKDAATTAIWGSKGANGVLMITTKTGTKGKIRFNYNYELGSNRQPPSVPMLNGDEYVTLQLEEWHNARGVYDIPDEIAFNVNYADFYNYSANTNWIEEITRNSLTNDHYFQMTGGGSKSRYLTSVNYLDEKGTTINTGFKRLTTRVNFDYELSDDVLITTNFKYANSLKEDNYIVTGVNVEGDRSVNIREMAYVKAPNMTVWEFDEAGLPTGEYFTPIESYQGSGNDYFNPVAIGNLGMNDRLENSIENNFKISYTPYYWLRFRETLSFMYLNTKANKFLPSSAIGADWLDSDINKADERNGSDIKLFSRTQIFIQPFLRSKNHDLIISGAWEMERKQSQYIELRTSNGPSIFMSDPSNGAPFSRTSSSSQEFTLYGALASMNYKFKDRYLFTFNMRGDASSVFGESNRWGVFPSVSGAWRFSEEPFMQSLNFLNESKLRLSWGQAGRAPNNPYARYATYSTEGQYMLEPVIIPSQIQLSRLRWETLTSVNAGLELSLFDNRLFVTAEVYKKITKDLLHSNYTIPSFTGYNRLRYYNGGELENKGWEYYMQWIALKKKDLSWMISFNVSRNNNSFLSFPENFVEEQGTSVENGVYPIKAELGKPVGSFFGFRYLGVYSTDEEAYARDANNNIILDGVGNPIPVTFNGSYRFQAGDAKYEDINNDGNIDIMDAVYIGDSSPEYTGGFSSTFRYKQLNVTLNFHYRLGFDIVNGVAILTQGMNNKHNQSKAVLNRWRWEGQDEENMLPRAYMDHIANNLGSDRYVEKGDFLRFNSLNINYRLNSPIAKKINVDGIELGFRIRNVLTFTRYSGQDPEIIPRESNPFWMGVDNARTPVPRTFTMTAKINF